MFTSSSDWFVELSVSFGFTLYKSDFYDANLVVLHRYLENDHIQHCVPSNVSSGLSFLPLSFVYVNGSANLTQKTTKVLPTGEPLNGAKAYIDILSYFTTTNNTPDEVHDLGYKMLYKLFPEVRFIFIVMYYFHCNQVKTKMPSGELQKPRGIHQNAKRSTQHVL